MNRRQTCGTSIRRTGWFGAVSIAGAAGCSVQEALVDGLYGGVSDTVASIVSNLLLGLLGGG
ncbi:MAG: hypothetical protein CHACPFDD_01486 [Phycisphaerae bacterium]|nr:hypothetical protein [Phycisphaerae bacterium]